MVALTFASCNVVAAFLNGLNRRSARAEPTSERLERFNASLDSLDPKTLLRCNLCP